MSPIEIDCYSLNFTESVHESTNPWTGRRESAHLLIPIGREQQTAVLALIERFSPILPEDSGQILLQVGDSRRILIDSCVRMDPGPVHLKIVVVSEPTLDVAQFVFDFAVASEMALMLHNLSITIAVVMTPVDRIPADWPLPKLCSSPTEVLELLQSSYWTFAQELERLKKLWR